jgi:hypothetical protein
MRQRLAARQQYGNTAALQNENPNAGGGLRGAKPAPLLLNSGGSLGGADRRVPERYPIPLEVGGEGEKRSSGYIRPLGDNFGQVGSTVTAFPFIFFLFLF